MRAIGASAWLMCSAPVMTSLVGGTCTLRKTRPSGESAGPLLPERSRAARISRKGSAATSAALTSRCAPRGLVGDAELERLRLAALDHVERLGDHVALDAAARDRAEEIALVVDDEIRADRPRRRSPRLDHRRERNPASLFLPILGSFENVFLARKHDVLVCAKSAGFRC